MWQDEGFNTFINTFSEARRFPTVGDQMERAAAERSEVEQAMKVNQDGPIMTPPDRISEPLLGNAAYVKPSVGLQLLRQEILGPDAFDDAFRTYIDALGVQASGAGGFLPHDGGCVGAPPRLVLARVVRGEPALRSGDRRRAACSTRATRTRCSSRTAIARGACCRFARASR